MLATILLLLLLSTSLAADAPMQMEDPVFLEELFTEGLLEAGRGGENCTAQYWSWYDTEGRLGHDLFLRSTLTLVHTTVYTLVSDPVTGLGAGFQYCSDRPLGSPVYAEIDMGYGSPTHAFNQRYSIYSAVGASYSTGYWQQYLFPVQGSRTGIDGLREGMSDSGDVVLYIQMFVSDSREVPSLSCNLEVIPNFYNSPTTLTIEYLPGNLLHNSVTSDTIVLSHPSPYSGSVTDILIWWKDGAPTEPSHISYLDRTDPIGPMKVTVEVEGYLQDTIFFEAEAGTRYNWSAVVETVESNSLRNLGAVNLPLPPPRNVLTLALERAITADFVPIVYLDEPTNPNGDGLRDVADLVKLKIK